MQELLTGQLFPLVLSLSLSGTLIGILIAALRPLTGSYFSKKWNYYIWLLVAARLLIPFHFEPSLLKPLQFTVMTDQIDDTVRPDHMVQNDVRTLHDSGLEPALQTTPAAEMAEITDMTDMTQPETHTPGTELHKERSHEEKSHETFSAEDIWAAAAYIWFFGAIAALLVRLSGYRLFHKRLKKDCTRITDSRITAMENAFCAGLRIAKAPVLYGCADTYSPMTIGLRSPMIILPKTVFGGGSTADSHTAAFTCPSDPRGVYQLQLILHHELVHAARRDLWYKWLCQLLLCVHWFNPVLHRIVRQINSDCELSCDEAILPELTESGKQMYGNILLDTAEQDITRRQTTFSTALLENRHHLKRRLDAILHYKKATRLRIALSACAFAIMLPLSACSAVWLAAGDASSAKSGSEGKDSWVFDDTIVFGNSSDSPEFYDNDEILAGKDIFGNWQAYNYVKNNHQKLSASSLKLFGSESFAIVYAERDTDVQITSSFDIPDGKFKIIHVAPDGSVVTLNDTGAETTQTVTMKKGRNVLKMVGQNKKLNNLKIDYSGIRESDFENVFYSEEEEYAYQVKNGLVPAEKDKIIDTLYLWDEKDASELFSTLLADGTSFTADELCNFLIYSDSALSSKYLSAALRDKTIAPLSPDTISVIMPHLEGDCRAEVLKSLSLEDFFDTFAENIYHLDDSQREDCLMDYIARGGTLTYSMYDEISYLLDDNTKSKLDYPDNGSKDLTGQITLPENIGNIKETGGSKESMAIVYESVDIRNYEDGSPYIHDALTNHTDKRIVETAYCMLAYNEKGAPLKLRWNFLDSRAESSYENLVRTKTDILPDQTQDGHGGWSLYDGERTENLPKTESGETGQVAYVLFSIKQVVFEDGTVWDNPDYENWFKTYAGKAIDVDELQHYYPHRYELDNI